MREELNNRLNLMISNQQIENLNKQKNMSNYIRNLINT